MLKKFFFGILFNIYLKLILLSDHKTNTMQILRGNKMLLAFSKVFEVRVGCTEIEIPNNYKKLILKLQSNYLNRILVTDQKIENCSENYNLKKCCSKNSTFCMENSNPTLNEFRLNYCIDYTYLYACYNPEDPLNREILNDNGENENILNNTDSNLTIIKNLTENNSNNTQTTGDLNNRILIGIGLQSDEIIGNIKVDADVVKGEGCTTAEFLPETECSTLGLLNCWDQIKCNKDCVYVECRQQQEDPKSKIFSMCLPVELRESEISARCKNHVAFKEIAPQPYRVNCTNVNDIYNVKKDSSHTFFKFLLIIMGVFLLALFISSVYYRYHWSNYKSEPFEPPSFCPNFVYPRNSVY